MKKETLESKTTEELREMAAKKGIEGRSQMNKSELVDALSDDKPDQHGQTGGTGLFGTKSKSQDMEHENREETVHGHITIKGSQSGDRRLFQTSPNVKEWLTQDEAEDKGHYWKTDEAAAKEKLEKP